MSLHTNQHISLEFNPQFEELYTQLHTQQDMLLKEYELIMGIFFDFVLEHKPRHLLLNLSDTDYIPPVPLQKVHLKQLKTIVQQIALQKLAVIVSHNYSLQLLIETALDRVYIPNFKIEYFFDKLDAVNWLRDKEIENTDNLPISV